MSASLYLNDFLTAIKAPDVFSKDSHKRNAAQKALESLNMLAKGDSAWIKLAEARVQFGKIFDPSASPKDAAVAHAKLVRLVSEIARLMPAAQQASAPPYPTAAAA